MTEHFRNAQWAVTSYGIECCDEYGQYDIRHDQLIGVTHLRAKYCSASK